MDDIVQAHYVGMLELLEKRNFPDRGRRDSLILGVERLCMRGGRTEILELKAAQLTSASSLIFFNATISDVTLSFALYTTPYVPSPTFSIFWYRSIVSTLQLKTVQTTHSYSIIQVLSL